MRKVYNKLVRDKIIEIIEASGHKAVYEVVSPENYKELLVKKMSEELQEFLESEEIVELADILEVIEAYIHLHGISWNELFDLKKEKAKARGGFEKRLFLKYVDEVD